uniref:Uncharacterized protein n=1 Tax=Arundo donax TaxID=35708 RepID=A0A0A9CZC2_ARUDO
MCFVNGTFVIRCHECPGTEIYMKPTCSGIYMKSPKTCQQHDNSTNKAKLPPKIMSALMHHSYRLQNLGSDISGLHSQAASILNNGDGTKCFPSNGSGH